MFGGVQTEKFYDSLVYLLPDVKDLQCVSRFAIRISKRFGKRGIVKLVPNRRDKNPHVTCLAGRVIRFNLA